MMRNAVEALDRLAGGLGTAVLALATVACWVVVGTASLFWIGLPLLPSVISMTRVVADKERVRLGRWGEQALSPYETSIEDLTWQDAVRAARRDPATWRDLRWLCLHATSGLVLGLLGIAFPVMAVRDLSFPLWAGLLPETETTSTVYLPVDSWTGIAGTALIGLVWTLLSLTIGPGMARLQALPGRRLLPPHPSVDLSHRIAQLTATRAGALQAHAAELRRIERSLHDGAQNRLVAVVVLVAAAKRALERDPATAGPVLDRAQEAAETALTELRGVVRGILPPILQDRGLAGSLAALASDCPVPCKVSVGELGALPLSVETTAYFTVAEALTNVAKHSGATHARVALHRRGDTLRVEIEDDGHGGAAERDGSGLAGIRRRVAAHDGVLTLDSPAGGPTRIEVELPCVS
ncbi:sensor histidine kinase [Nonomuraea harbinensis]|uniref:histidine kinase n=1 Tax=Nonomuraea harbinensis TaxID=1286938 RepID=A0ABW1CBB1_9ACTN|nr:sensor histidine kinase [Nonomuraea harbinensis]